MKRILLGLIWISLVARFAPLIPAQFWLFEVSDNFSLYFAFVHFPALLILPFLKGTCRPSFFWLSGLALIVSLVSCGATLFPFYAPYRQPILSCAHPHQLRISLANVSSDNLNPAQAVLSLLDRGDDVVALLEVASTGVEQGKALYSHRIFAHQVEGLGIGVLSRYPLGADPMLSLGDDIRPVMIVAPQLPDGATFRLAIFDALAPLENEALYFNSLLTRRMAILLRHEVRTGVVLADLNATPFSRFYKGFLKEAQLSDARWGMGLSRTWDMQSSLARFTIDHAFVKGEVAVDSASVFPVPGSDHLGLALAIRVCGES